MDNLKDKQTLREFLAEFIGTFMIIVIGDSAVATYVFKSKSRDANDSFAISFCWGFAVLIGVACTSHISGGHLNPAVSVTQAVFKNFPWKKLPHYLAGQYLGAFFASAVVYILYFDAINAFDDGIRSAYGHPLSTGHIFATYPSSFISFTNAVTDQVIGTAVLLFAVLTITEKNRLPDYLQPLYLFLTITALCTAFSYNCGATLNPARDISPRLFTYFFGWSSKTFEPLNYNYFWIAILGPHMGAIIGAALYYITIGWGKLSRAHTYTVDAPASEKEEIEVISTADAKRREAKQSTPL